MGPHLGNTDYLKRTAGFDGLAGKKLADFAIRVQPLDASGDKKLSQGDVDRVAKQSQVLDKVLAGQGADHAVKPKSQPSHHPLASFATSQVVGAVMTAGATALGGPIIGGVVGAGFVAKDVGGIVFGHGGSGGGSRDSRIKASASYGLGGYERRDVKGNDFSSGTSISTTGPGYVSFAEQADAYGQPAAPARTMAKTARPQRAFTAQNLDPHLHRQAEGAKRILDQQAAALGNLDKNGPQIDARANLPVYARNDADNQERIASEHDGYMTAGQSGLDLTVLTRSVSKHAPRPHQMAALAPSMKAPSLGLG